MTAKTTAKTTATTAVMDAEYHPEIASKGLDHSFGAAVIATRKGGKPANVISAKAAKAEAEAEAAAKRGTWDQAIAALKAGMASDARKLKTLDNAREALLVVRCDVVRATAHAMTFPESHAKAGATAGQPSQSVIAAELGINRLSFAPYFKAATDLYAKFPELETEAGTAVTEDEKEHVASFWKSEALRAKARRDAAKAKAEQASGPVEVIAQGDGTEDDADGGTAGVGGTDGRTSPVTADTAIAALAVLAKTLQAMADGTLGFTAEQAELMTDGLMSASAAVEALTIAAK